MVTVLSSSPHIAPATSPPRCPPKSATPKPSKWRPPTPMISTPAKSPPSTSTTPLVPTAWLGQGTDGEVLTITPWRNPCSHPWRSPRTASHLTPPVASSVGQPRGVRSDGLSHGARTAPYCPVEPALSRGARTATLESPPLGGQPQPEVTRHAANGGHGGRGEIQAGGHPDDAA